MSKLFILQLVFVAVLVVAVLAIGCELYILDRIDPDVLLTWGYAAAVGFVGSWICLILRLLLGHHRKPKE